jgi:hypothetical protein
MASSSTSSLPAVAVSRARTVGARTGMVLAVLMGGALAAISDELYQCMVIVAATMLVVVAARFLGAWVATHSLGHGIVRAMGLGVLGGLACMLLADLSACVMFGLKLVHGVSELGVLFGEEASLLFLVIALVGAPFATALGAVHGVVVHRLTRASARVVTNP